MLLFSAPSRYLIPLCRLIYFVGVSELLLFAHLHVMIHKKEGSQNLYWYRYTLLILFHQTSSRLQLTMEHQMRVWRMFLFGWLSSCQFLKLNTRRTLLWLSHQILTIWRYYKQVWLDLIYEGKLLYNEFDAISFMFFKPLTVNDL